MRLETVEVITGSDSGTVGRDGNHSELTSGTLCREVAESHTSGPDVSHGRAEESADFSPETRWALNIAEFAEVRDDVIASECTVLVIVYAWLRVTAPFAINCQYDNSLCVGNDLLVVETEEVNSSCTRVAPTRITAEVVCERNKPVIIRINCRIADESRRTLRSPGERSLQYKPKASQYLGPMETHR